MKLSFITTGDIQNIATSKRAFGLAEPMKRLGYQVSIIAEDTPNNRLRIEQEAPSAETKWFPSCGAFEEARRKRNILAEIQPDYIYVSALGIRNFVWSRKLSKQADFVIEHSELASAIKNQSYFRQLFSFALEKASLFLFDGHVVASRYLDDYITRDLKTYFLSRPVHYSPYAYSEKMLVCKPEISQSLDENTRSKQVLVYMGTLSANYGILDIIQAVAKIKGKYPNVLLYVLGKGRDEKLAQSKIEELNLIEHVKLEGYVSDEALPSYLAMASAFIAPLYNTIQDIARCPSKLFLYMPFGKPIVTCRIGEAETLFGDYDYYFSSGNIDSMVQALTKALDAETDWRMPWRAEEHSWESRAHAFHKWLLSLRSKEKVLEDAILKGVE